MGKRVWTDATREEVRRLFTVDGLSYGQIADRLGMSRDTVAGLVNRMKLAGQGRNAARGGRRKPAPDAAPKAATANLIDLGRGCCTWPIGDPKSPAFAYCGAAIDGRGPYCVAHRRKAYTAPDRRERGEDRRDRRGLWS
jgi:GcrA cell cycle regulator